MTDATHLIRPQGQFLRSAQLERDFDDPEALQGFVLTPAIVEFLTRIESSLRPESGDRSFRILGHYGSGKSTFALFVAQWLRRNYSALPQSLVEGLRKRGLGRKELPSLTPLLVTCRREPMAKAIQRAVTVAIPPHDRAGSPELGELLDREEVQDGDALDLLNYYRDYVSRTANGTGILLVIDEAGKLLEYAAQNTDKTDVYLWQQLSETVMNSRKSPVPFLMVSIFHQGFAAYASELGMSSLNEWNKVAGRFTELNFQPSVDQTLVILSAALNVDLSGLDDAAQTRLETQMALAVQNRWYSVTSDAGALCSLAPKLFPLNPFVIPPLERLLRKYGQNERSMFSFLFGGESHSLLPVLELGHEEFSLADLYDYFYGNYDQVISDSSEASRWVMVKNLLSSICGEDPLTDRIVKSIGILNVLNADDLLPTAEVLLGSLSTQFAEADIRNRIDRLSSKAGKRVIYNRGDIGGLSLWSHVSVDIETAFREADGKIGPVANSIPHLVEHLGTDNLVARRHYMQTGNLRYFALKYCSFSEFDTLPTDTPASAADGMLIVPLCSSKVEIDKARTKARTFVDDLNTVVAIPNRSLGSVRSVVRELLVWDSLILNTPELNGDPYAQETVSLQREHVRRRFCRDVNEIAGVGQHMQVGDLDVYWKGRKRKTGFGGDKKSVTVFLSKVFDEVYTLAPEVHNELLNRDRLSSAGAAAQMRLIEGILERRSQPLLGMDPNKRPPEMSMYLSVLRQGGIHVEVDGEWGISLPQGGRDELNVRPSLLALLTQLEQSPDVKISVSSLISDLAGGKYGVKTGLAYVLLAVFTVLHEKEVAVYEEGRFLSEVTGAEFQRMVKKPGTFEMQWCRVSGVRAEIYARMATLLGVGTEGKEIDLLEVVRPLCVFAAQLPPYVVNTKRLSATSLAVRDALLKAREPIKVLFTDLPEACGVSALDADLQVSEVADTLLERLKGAIQELRESYYQLQQRILAYIREAFGCEADASWHADLSARAKGLFGILTEPTIKAFCFRLSDSALSEEEWGVSVAALLASRPPREWGDREENTFKFELGQYVSRLKRAEEAAFGREGTENSHAVRLSLTQADGTEVTRILSRQQMPSVAEEETRATLREIVEKQGEDALAILFDVLMENAK